MENSLPYTFAIIGGGFTATSMLFQIIYKISNMAKEGRQISHQISIVIFEKKSVLGPGLPHNEQYVLPFHITNMCSEDMSVRYDRPADFQNWVQQNNEIIENMYPGLIPAYAREDRQGKLCHHYPRAVFGKYLESRFEEAVETSHHLGMSIELCPNCEVTDLFEDSGHICLSVNGSNDTTPNVRKVDGVLLATGHWFGPSETENYFPSPWPASALLANIPTGQKVGVIGSSLSAIEVALTLSSDGLFARQQSGELSFTPSSSPRKITFYSRNGLLPRVRGRIGTRPNLHLTCSTILELILDNPCRVSLLSVFDLLDRELTAAYGSRSEWQQILSPSGDAVQILRQDIKDARKGDGPDNGLIWQTVLAEIFPVVRDLYLNLTLADREYFDRRFNTLFFMHAATQPVINGEKLHALMQAGIVSVVKLGSDYCFKQNGATRQFEFIYKNPQGDVQRDSSHYVINACGQARSLESDTSLLMKNLFKRGLVQIQENQLTDTGHYFSYKTGSILVDPETHQVIRPGANRLNPTCLPIFAVGAMTRGQMIDVSMAYGIARSTAAVAEGVLALVQCKI